jgi:hypothetical protein
VPRRALARTDREASDVSEDGTQQEVQPTAEDASRSGRDVREAVDRAASGTPHAGVQTPPEDAEPHAAPVEQVRGDAAMTQGQIVEGQVVDGPGVSGDVPSAPDTGAMAGGAQSMVGARESDRVAGGGEPASGPG